MHTVKAFYRVQWARMDKCLGHLLVDCSWNLPETSPMPLASLNLPKDE